ncbi:MAG TPA: NADH-quinone oxidoreductase subunit NuoB [Dissulfurispiraceae bacterium]|nr:NADH-quinone oxidoreductase subunit NuoB [Dissulfurispiraceae bacterium]
MIRILYQILRTGIRTEQLPELDTAKIRVLGAEMQEVIRNHFNGSLTVRQIDAGSCNGCEIEIHAMNNVFYNCERFGIHFAASPRFADMLLVTGPVAHNMGIALKRTYDSTPSPKLVVAVGDCGFNGGIFGKSYASCGGVHEVIPVDAVIPGCPPTPIELLSGILKLLRLRIP